MPLPPQSQAYTQGSNKGIDAGIKRLEDGETFEQPGIYVTEPLYIISDSSVNEALNIYQTTMETYGWKSSDSTEQSNGHILTYLHSETDTIASLVLVIDPSTLDSDLTGALIVMVILSEEDLEQTNSSWLPVPPSATKINKGDDPAVDVVLDRFDELLEENLTAANLSLNQQYAYTSLSHIDEIETFYRTKFTELGWEEIESQKQPGITIISFVEDDIHGIMILLIDKSSIDTAENVILVMEADFMQ